ncbi:Sodium/hydrogen exchanger 2, partial [Frankliniella fusca]
EEGLSSGEDGAAAAAAFIEALTGETVEAVDALIELHDGVPAPSHPCRCRRQPRPTTTPSTGAPRPLSPWSSVGWRAPRRRRSSPQQLRGDPGRQLRRDTVQPCPSTSPSPRKLAGGLGRGDGTGAGVPSSRPPQRLWPSPAPSSPCARRPAPETPSQGEKGASSLAP